jgi:hypothetical protein
MNTTDLKQQIAERIQTLVDALKSEGSFREVGEVVDVTLEAKVMPSCYYQLDDDTPDDVQDDTRGYNLAFNLYLKITADGKNLPKEIRRLTALVQEKMETDLDLGTLAKWITYLGDSQFLHLDGQTGGNILSYRVQYRRLRGSPDQSY